MGHVLLAWWVRSFPLTNTLLNPSPLAVVNMLPAEIYSAGLRARGYAIANIFSMGVGFATQYSALPMYRYVHIPHPRLPHLATPPAPTDTHTNPISLSPEQASNTKQTPRAGQKIGENGKKMENISATDFRAFRHMHGYVWLFFSGCMAFAFTVILLTYPETKGVRNTSLPDVAASS